MLLVVAELQVHVDFLVGRRTHVPIGDRVRVRVGGLRAVVQQYLFRRDLLGLIEELKLLG